VDLALPVAHGEARDGRLERRSVRAAPVLALVLEGLARGDAAHELQVPLQPALLHEHVAAGRADGDRLGHAEHACGGGVPGQDGAVEREAHDRVARGLDDRGEPALLLLRLPLGGDVAADGGHADDAVLCVADRSERAGQDELPAPGVEPRRFVVQRLAGARTADDLRAARELGRLGADRVQDGGADLLLGEAEHGGRRGVEVGHAAVDVHPDDRLARGAHDRGEPGALGVRADLVGHVAGGRRQADGAAVLAVDRRDGQRHLHERAVLAQPLGEHALHDLPAEHPAQHRALLVLALRWEDERDVPADGFLGRVPEQPLGRRVPVGDDAVEVLGEDRVLRAADDRRQPPQGVQRVRRLARLARKGHDWWKIAAFARSTRRLHCGSRMMASS
jgi:hypothetical protein